MKFVQLKTELADKHFFPVAVVSGEDAFLRANAVEQIVKGVNVNLPELNFNTFDGTSLDIEQVLYACQSMPFGSERKIVLVRGLTLTKDGKTNNIVTKLSAYSKSPSESAVLVIETTTAFPLENIAGITFVDCGKLDNYAISLWVSGKVAEKQKTIDKDATNLLCDYCIRDMSRISSELQKLLCLSHNNITTEDVRSQVYQDAEFAVFDLSTYISAKNSFMAQSVFDNLISRGEEVIKLFGLLYNFYRRMYYISVSRDLTQSEIADKLGVKEYAVKKAKEVADTYKPATLKKSLDYFYMADIKLKKFYKDTEVMRLLIFQLLSL
ncbi:MAG: DNA polymerase III subunit delta [Clostridia bacterium]